MTDNPKTINKYKSSKLVDRHDMEQSECREDDNTGCPYYSDGDDASIKKQSEGSTCKKGCNK
ncbi:MAG: hypothetical protein LBL47_04660 [Lactobacillus sp.]|jgi:hypothetical protein|nr:hypothetical protein [Lactobacillus sp.]